VSRDALDPRATPHSLTHETITASARDALARDPGHLKPRVQLAPGCATCGMNFGPSLVSRCTPDARPRAAARAERAQAAFHSGASGHSALGSTAAPPDRSSLLESSPCSWQSSGY